MPAGAGSAGDTYPGNVLGGWGSGLNFNWEGIYGLNLPGFITIADFNLPVGLGGVPIFQPGLQLPQADAEVVTLEQQDRDEERHEFISDQVDRRDITSNEANVQDVSWNPDYAVSAPSLVLNPQQLADKAWFDKMFPGQTYVPPNSTILPTSPSTPTASIVSTEDNVGWISDVYATVDQTVFGGALPGGYIAPSIGQNLGGIVGQTFGPPATAPVVVAPVAAIPGGIPVASAGCEEDPMKGMVLKKHCGEWRWVKQKRRRRRAIVTQQDLRGLAALKGVLGQGKAFEVWIATHS